ncbi:MAG TPA: sigma 54-interacting transcriptional regulator [Dongiaceae bacterium]|nr:sigma 54-interacting transcriptional regulator [Dongiaceae bacterium]
MDMLAESIFEGNHHVYDLPPDLVLFGRSRAMQEVKRRLVRICNSTVPVLLQGEVGVGKSVLSRFIHQHSGNGSGPYVQLNCAGLPGITAYVNPFAYISSRASEAASEEQPEAAALRSGTMYLDQVDELPPAHQQLLAESLGEWEDQRLLTPDLRHQQAHIISASTCDLHQRVRQGRFRQDLYDRLAVVTIDVPPLRCRIEDLPELCEYLAKYFAQHCGVDDRPFPPELLTRMHSYAWPGNMRELQNFVCRYVVLGTAECAAS